MTTAPATASATEGVLARYDPRRALLRLAIALVAGTIAGFAMATRFAPTLAALAGWDLGALVLLTLAWLFTIGCDADRTRARAGSEDPGRRVVYVLVTLTSGVSLFAATVLSRRARTESVVDSAVIIGLCLVTVTLSWLLTQTSFTMRYAHLYYREDKEGIGGVEFPGGAAPCYYDFAYFAFTVGMCFQVSDCTVSSSQIRRTVLIHAALSFAYNTVILAFVLNLVFGAATG